MSLIELPVDVFPQSRASIRPSARPRGTNGVNSYGEERPDFYEGVVMSLYVMYCKGFAKIGISTNPEERLSNMQGGCPFLIELLTYYPMKHSDARIAERLTMERLDEYHLYGEWFYCKRNVALFAAAAVAKKFKSASYTPPQKKVRWPRLARRVRTPEGDFASSVEAGAHYGISKQSAYQRANKQRNGWAFLDEVEGSENGTV